MARGRGFGKSGVTADINVTPMADIMLVLLIIFMITTPLLQSGITVNLPKAKNPLEAPEADSKEAVVIAINRDGRLYVAKKQVSEQELYDLSHAEILRRGDQPDNFPQGRYCASVWPRCRDCQRLPQSGSRADRLDGGERKRLDGRHL